jgi:hypothetical protein
MRVCVCVCVCGGGGRRGRGGVPGKKASSHFRTLIVLKIAYPRTRTRLVIGICSKDPLVAGAESSVESSGGFTFANYGVEYRRRGWASA